MFLLVVYSSPIFGPSLVLGFGILESVWIQQGHHVPVVVDEEEVGHGRAGGHGVDGEAGEEVQRAGDRQPVVAVAPLDFYI